MGYMTINNRRVAFTDEKNVLSVIRKSGIDLPTFCYHSELSTYGACRMCVVEDERGKVFASCSEVPRDGMVIYTNTPRLQHHRKMIIELLLSSHCRDCTTCAKNGVCTLQKLASQLGISEIRFENHKKPLPLDTSSDCVIRDPNKCILCGDCVRTCDEIQGLGILDFAFRGSKMQVMPAFNRELAETDCVGCDSAGRSVRPVRSVSGRMLIRYGKRWRIRISELWHRSHRLSGWRSEINLESRKVKIHWDAWWQLCDIWDLMRYMIQISGQT